MFCFQELLWLYLLIVLVYCCLLLASWPTWNSECSCIYFVFNLVQRTSLPSGRIPLLCWFLWHQTKPNKLHCQANYSPEWTMNFEKMTEASRNSFVKQLNFCKIEEWFLSCSSYALYKHLCWPATVAWFGSMGQVTVLKSNNNINCTVKVKSPHIGALTLITNCENII